MDNQPNRMNIKDFLEEGYLQEVNRQFFHPLGLALEVLIDDNGNYTLGGIWDYRNDPEGMYYGPLTIKWEKVENVLNQKNKIAKNRFEKLGYDVQPVP